MNYRPEVDGLRAIAVLPVMFFHAGFSIFSGGFVGVDVFFVISGYLITGILIKELTEERYSILRFYERRARRILPALSLVVLVSIPFAWMWMIPSEFELFSQSVGTVVIFLSNFLFLSEVGYFAPDAELQPLIHTWSLAIEEQFYLLFPFILWAAYRLGKARLALGLTVLLTLGSLALCLVLLPSYPHKSFYFSPSRFWEILAGSVVALATFRRPLPTNNILSLIGLVMICGAIFLFDSHTPFPSLYTLIPVVGSALVLAFAGPGTWVAQLLSFRGFVGVGLISYSAYLWHQPLFAFARIRSFGEPGPGMMLALIALTLLLAYLTWRWVETPFRKPGHGFYPSRAQIFLGFSGLGALMFAFGLYGHLNEGAPDRMPAHVQKLLSASEDTSPYKECEVMTGEVDHPVSACLVYAEDDMFDVVFIGDSHLGSAAYEFQNALQERGITSYSIALPGCLGFPGFYEGGTGKVGRCDTYTRGMLDFAKERGAKVVVLTSRLPMYLTGIGFDNGEGGVEKSLRGARLDYPEDSATHDDFGDEARQRRVLRGYQQEAEKISDDFKLVWLEPVPEAGWNVPSVLARRAMLGAYLGEPLSTPYDAYLTRTQKVRDTIAGMSNPNIFSVNASQAFCNTHLSGRCLNELEGAPLYWDDDHLTNAGARLLAPLVADVVEKALAAE